MMDFPWADLKAETLRAICRDLGMQGNRKRDDMVSFLKTVQDSGLEAGLTAANESKEPREESKGASSATNTTAALNRKRKATKEEHPPTRITRSTDIGPISLNTRSSGAKRTKVSENTSKHKPRANGTRARGRKSPVEKAEEPESASAPIRKRPVPKSKTTASSDKPVSQKAAFDGVLLPVPIHFETPSDNIDGERNNETSNEDKGIEADPKNLEKGAPTDPDLSEPQRSSTPQDAYATKGNQDATMNGHLPGDHTADEDAEGSIDLNAGPTVSEPPTTRASTQEPIQVEDADTLIVTTETVVVAAEVVEPISPAGDGNPDITMQTSGEESTDEIAKDIEMAEVTAITEVIEVTSSDISDTGPSGIAATE